MKNSSIKILLTGGGSGGPVVPLLAVQEFIKARFPDAEFFFIGTKSGPEAAMVGSHDTSIKFATVPNGKLRRYFSIRNFTAPFEVFVGILKSLYLVAAFKPNVVFSAGGYVSVPVVIAAWLLGRKVAIHQQDVEPSMSNQILAPLASKITVSLPASVNDFDQGKVVLTGNPYRSAILNAQPAALFDGEAVPTVLITGGGTGAAGLNEIVAQALPDLTKFCCVVHLTGKGKAAALALDRYKSLEFTQDMPSLLAAADVVVSRAGMSTITELSVTGKVAVIVSMPDSHQEANAAMLESARAAVVLSQKGLTAANLAAAIKNLLDNEPLKLELSENIKKLTPLDSTAAVSQVILSLCNQ